MNIKFRFATEEDADLYFKWTNDPIVRMNSYDSSEIIYKNHIEWFKTKIKDSSCYFYLFQDENNNMIGQIRINNIKPNIALIGISVDIDFRFKGIGHQILSIATEDYLQRFPIETIYAYIKKENQSSHNSFLKAGFNLKTMEIIHGIESYVMIKSQRNEDC